VTTQTLERPRINKNAKIECAICGAKVHHIESHLKDSHPDYELGRYQNEFPQSPLVSPAFEEAQELARQKKLEEARAQHHSLSRILPSTLPGSTEKKPLYEVFGLPLDDTMRSAKKKNQTEGDPIMIDVMVPEKLDQIDQDAIPAQDDGYVFRAEELKDVVMAIVLNMPALVWGFHGSGKTTLIEQIHARMKRPMLRVQHTDTTEEAHIVGQMVVRNGGTEWDFGPLAEAMMRGWTYLADEYDFAHPAVIAVYQAVLEGKPLYIKEAPPHQRLVKPHPNFRFIATGNTNGSGDDTGLYSGTKIGNAAAYSRFGITVQAHYPEPEVEAKIVRSHIAVPQEIADKMVDVAGRIRDMYGKGELSLPISPRELIRATILGAVKGGQFTKGLELAYINRLDNTQGEAVRQAAQRVFG
jgi:cobaltochelatase CobS